MEDSDIRNLAIQYALKLAIEGTEPTETDAIIASANKIAAFIKDGTVPSS